VSENLTKLNLKSLETLKTQIKSDLDGNFGADFSQKKRHYINQKISELDDSAEELILVKKLILVNHLMFGHARTGLIGTRELERTVKLGESLAKVLLTNQNSVTKRVCIEFRHASSLVHRREGRHDAAAWEHIRARMSRTAAKEPVAPFEVVGTGIRMFRAGRTSAAMELFEDALRLELETSNRTQAVVGIVKCLRLNSDHDASIQFAKTHLVEFKDYLPARLELEWEIALNSAFKTNDQSNLSYLTRPGGTHRLPSYLLDCFFISRASAAQSSLELPKVSYLSRRSELDFQPEGAYLDAALALEGMDDPGVPLELRLDVIGECFANRAKIIAVDQELLFLAGLSQKLYQMKLTQLGNVVEQVYRGLCLTVSEGRSDDIYAFLTQQLKASA
jgi:hypothetical protein